MREKRREATSPAMREMASPWKMGSKRMTEAPTTTAAAVSIMGRNRTAPASIDRLVQGHALLDPQFDEVHQDDGVAHHDAGPGDEADHGGGGEKGAHEPSGPAGCRSGKRGWRP